MTSWSLPELKKVLLVAQAQVVYADTLHHAIDQLVGTTTAPPPNQPPVTITPAVIVQITDLVTQANVHYPAAYQALATGDFTTFASETKTVSQLLTQLQAATGTAASTGTAPSP